METIVLTGFGPFGDHTENNSEHAVHRLDGLEVHGFKVRAVSLPVAFEQAVELLDEALEPEPAAVLSVGISSEDDGYQLELLARNLRDYRLPDAAGQVVTGQPVEVDGPPQVVATLPVASIKQALTQAGLRAQLSDDAGAYLCNAIFYWVARRVSPAGFLHVPSAPERLDEVTEAVRLAVEVTAERLAAQRVEATA